MRRRMKSWIRNSRFTRIQIDLDARTVLRALADNYELAAGLDEAAMKRVSLDEDAIVILTYDDEADITSIVILVETTGESE